MPRKLRLATRAGWRSFVAQPLQRPSPVTPRRSRGFTLIELMIVVVIVGILATLAVVGYRKLVQASHVSEATGMVQNIRVAQESYHSETQQYANVSGGLLNFYPAFPSYQIVRAWGGPCALCTGTVAWSALPVHVDGPVLFGYATIAGIAGGPAPPVSVSVNGAPLVFPAAPTTDWYIISSEADLDGTAGETTNTHVYGTSWTNQIFVDHEGQ
jgi:type IV pilus assembly protein PilA